MRLLAFSDLHRDVAKAELIAAASASADVVVGAGDFATMGMGLADTLGILRRVTVPVLLVCGNHESLADLREACAGWAAARILHAEAVTLETVTFFGLGYEISTVPRGPWNSQISEEQASLDLADCPAGAVLITHAPPFGVADTQADGTHDGSRAIRAAIEIKKPKLSLCGHIHNAWGRSGMIGASPVHNLGPALRWFDI